MHDLKISICVCKLVDSTAFNRQVASACAAESLTLCDLNQMLWTGSDLRPMTVLPIHFQMSPASMSNYRIVFPLQTYGFYMLFRWLILTDQELVSHQCISTGWNSTLHGVNGTWKIAMWFTIWIMLNACIFSLLNSNK